MNLLEKTTRQADLPTPLISENRSRAIWRLVRGILRIAGMVVVGGTVHCVPLGPSVLANTGHQSASKEDSAIDPDAMAALNKMGTYLRTLKAFQVSCR